MLDFSKYKNKNNIIEQIGEKEGMSTFKENIVTILDLDYNKTIKEASTVELYNAVSKAAMKSLANQWSWETDSKKVCYFSAEFLIGRLVYNNLMNLGLMNQLADLFAENGIDIRVFEEIEDNAQGNGGLGRLAACFLDSAATQNVTLNGYGIRYRYGIYKQYFENGFQKETADNWTKFGDPWSVRREEDKVRIDFKGQSVWAVPYDTPVIGYGAAKINTLRLWQAEPIEEFNFGLFNDQKYDKSFKEKNDAEAITAVLYPNDSTDAGKKLRLKQQYFFWILLRNTKLNMAMISLNYLKNMLSSLMIHIQLFQYLNYVVSLLKMKDFHSTKH